MRAIHGAAALLTAGAAVVVVPHCARLREGFEWLHAAELEYDAAEAAWAGALANVDAEALRDALERYRSAAEIVPPAKGDEWAVQFIAWLARYAIITPLLRYSTRCTLAFGGRASRLTSHASLMRCPSHLTHAAPLTPNSFRPLRLRSLHRVAAASELLRDDLPAIAAAHQALLDSGYCTEVVADADAATPEQLAQLYARCIAPIARGTVLFAGSVAAAEAAFERARAIETPASIVGPASATVLSWSNRLQLPDRHDPALLARPWWTSTELSEVYAAIAASATMLQREFEAVFEAVGGSDGFAARRADSWLPEPSDGWGRVPLAPQCDGAAAETCQLIDALAGRHDVETPGNSGSPLGVESGSSAGYYLMRPGTRIRAHVGPTNARLTCHYVLRDGGGGAALTVAGETKNWVQGETFCFDDSFVHEAEHTGTADRYIFLFDLSHPDLELKRSLPKRRSV